MALAATLAIAGLIMEVVGNGVAAFGNRNASIEAEADLRANAAEQQRLLGMQTSLGRERLTESRDNTLTDIGIGTANAQSSLQAGAAASGVRGSSGSVGAVSSNINAMSDMARDRTQTEFSLGMKSVDLQAAQGQYTIDNMTSAADAEAANRGWAFAGDLLGAGTAATRGLQEGAETGWWGLQ